MKKMSSSQKIIIIMESLPNVLIYHLGRVANRRRGLQKEKLMRSENTFLVRHLI
jgi:hypothetical protein